MVSIKKVWTGTLLLHFLWRGIISLELLPSISRVVLKRNTSYSVVCSGWSDVTWLLPEDGVVAVSVENLGSSSVLRLSNATWRQSGRYTCSELDSDQTKTLDLFVPGTEPSEWFVPSPVAVVMRRTRSAVVPCVVSDPDLRVDLWERSGSLRTAVTPVQFDPALGFKAELNDSSYICSAHRDHQEVLSQVYYIFSIVGPDQLQVELWSSALILMEGDPLMVNCTVSESESVFFSWDFPRKHHSDTQEIEPLTEFLTNHVRSFINISETTLQDSGVYVCSVEESLQKQTMQKSLNISVLSRGFVDLSPCESTVVLTLLHHTVALSLHIRAYPPPNITWTISTASGPSIISMATKDPNIIPATTSISASTAKLSHTRFLSVLKMEDVQMNQTGSYVATVSNIYDVKEAEFMLEVTAPPKIRSLSEVDVASVMCVSEGAPAPKLNWFTCPPDLRCTDGGWRNVSELDGASVKENSTEKQGLTLVYSVVTLKSLDSVSSVRCESKNSVGRRAWDLRLVPSSLLSQVKVLTAVLVLVVLAVIFLILLIIVWRKKPRLDLGWWMLESASPDGLQVSYFDPSELPYKTEWEVPKENIKLGSVVSSGTFGQIVEASVLDLTGPNSSTKATVTTGKGGAALQSLLSDLKILLHVGNHLNLLNLLGACTKDGALMVISEWCHHGDLSFYLRKHKNTFTTGSVHCRSESDGYMDMNSDGSQYIAMKQLCVPQQPEYEILHNTPNTSEQQGALSDSEDLSLSDLVGFCFQTASAMVFLSQRNVIHRDLGARNVLVSNGKLLKICDLGFGRDLNKRPEYEHKGNARLPVKWMSPESIFLSVYTVQSDVWSYGVLLWEIFSLGELPYPQVPVSQFCSDLKRGRRLNKPDHASEEIFSLMCQCWEKSADCRPSFSSLLDSVGKLLPPTFHQNYSALTEQFQSNPTAVQRRTQTELGLTQDQDSAILQVTVHLSEAEPQSPGPTDTDNISTPSMGTIEMRRDTALDAEDQDKLELSE